MYNTINHVFINYMLLDVRIHFLKTLKYIWTTNKANAMLYLADFDKKSFTIYIHLRILFCLVNKYPLTLVFYNLSLPCVSTLV